MLLPSCLNDFHALAHPVTKKLHGSKGMGKRLYKRAKHSTPALMDAAARELETLEARLATKLLASSDNTPVAMHPRVVGYAAFLERPAETPTSPLPLSPAAAAAAAAGAATAVTTVRRHRARPKSAGGADVRAKGSAAGGGKSSHRRPRIYSRENPLETPPSSPRHTRLSAHRKQQNRQHQPTAAAVRGGGNGGALGTMVPSSSLTSSVKMSCGDDSDDFDCGAGEFGGSKRKSASAFAAAETSTERKGGDDCRGTTGFLNACGFTGYRSDSMLPPLLSSSLQGEDGSCLGSDDNLQYPTLPDVGPSLSPDPGHQDDSLQRGGGVHPVLLETTPGYSMALMPPREQNDGRSSTSLLPSIDMSDAAAAAAAVSSSAVGGPPTERQQRRQAPATTPASDDDVAYLGARGGVGGIVPAGRATAAARSTKRTGGDNNRDAGHLDITSVPVPVPATLVHGVSPEVAAAKAGAVVSSMVIPMDMDMDFDWLQVGKLFLCCGDFPSSGTCVVTSQRDNLCVVRMRYKGFSYRHVSDRPWTFPPVVSVFVGLLPKN